METVSPMLAFWQFVGGSTILLAFVGWLVRSLSAQVLSKDIEKFKAQLALQSVEHKIRFARLHERVAVTTAGTYARLQRISDCLHDFLNLSESASDPKRKEYLGALHEAYIVFETYFKPRRIFFAKETATLIWEAVKEMQTVGWEFDPMMAVNPIQAQQLLIEGSRSLKTKIRPLLEQLETEFRGLLGSKGD